MTVSSTQGRAIDYAPCRYNGSRLWFRGPKRSLRTPYISCLGGCDVYGRYLDTPFPDMLQAETDRTVVSLAVEHAGLDAYLNDPGALATAAQAQTVLVHVTGSQNTSNRFYTVHPRRNDRFLKASSALRSLYPEMDFTEVHFTGHLLHRLQSISEARFEQIVEEIRRAWGARMRHLISQMDGDVILFWFAPAPMAEPDRPAWVSERFLDKATVTLLVPYVSTIIECVPKDWRDGASAMQVPPMDVNRAEGLPGPGAHRMLADVLGDIIKPVTT